MAASRSSGDWRSETYQGTHQGRASSGDIGWEQFPEKMEVTDIYEDPDQVDEDRRNLLRDFTPDQTSLFEDAAPRRNTHAVEQLNLRENGARVTTEPWQNEDYDTQFHDHDPRGWSTEQPYDEYRRQLMANMRRADFVDDGDYSIPETGISPFTMNQQIRSTQNWFKERFKNFDTSFDNFHAGGVGTYPHMSYVFKGDVEDGTVNIDHDPNVLYANDGATMGGNTSGNWTSNVHGLDGQFGGGGPQGGHSGRFSDAETAQHTTIHLSNILHQGSPLLRSNDTTDHKVAVSAYGKLYAQSGLMKHESALRSLEDDTPRQRAHAAQSTRSLQKMMSARVDPDGDEQTTAAAARSAQQNTDGDRERFGGRATNREGANRSIMLTRDIMALFGYVEQDYKQIRQLQRENSTMAAPLLANLYKLGLMVHKMPANVKLELRNELLLKAGGNGRKLGDYSKTRYMPEVNPKLIKFMETAVRTNPDLPRDTTLAQHAAATEGRKYGLPPSDAYIMISASVRPDGDVTANRHAGAQSDAKPKPIGVSSRVVGNYASLAKAAVDYSAIGHNSERTAHDTTSRQMQHRAPALRGSENVYAANTAGVAVDVQFGDTAGLRRHSKSPQLTGTIRRNIVEDRVYTATGDLMQQARLITQ